jgi:hypothetical protein
MKRVQLLALGLLLVAGCALVYLKSRSDGLGEQKVVDGQPLPDVATEYGMPNVAGSSKWLTEHTRRHRGLFKDFQCNVLVVPVQVEQFAFDRPTRLLMSGDLANALATGTTCVTDPFVVDDALGEGMRVYAPADIEALATEIKALTIVRAFAGHDAHQNMRVTLQVDRWNSSTQTFVRETQRTFSDLDYSYTASPYAQFHARLPAMLDAVALPHEQHAAVKSNIPDSMPSSPTQASSTDGSPAASAMNLMLLGMLAPTQDRHVADRLFAKAYLALQNLGNDDIVVRMRARAMLHMGGRPYALLEAANLKGAEADGLRAIANGDLPGARSALDNLHEPWDYAFLSLETFDLELGYRNRTDARVKHTRDTFSAAWQPLLSMRATNEDKWADPDPIALKESLDGTFPVKGESLKELAMGNAITGAFDESNFAVLAARHVRKLLDDQSKSFCCASFSTAVQPLDVLILYEARAEDALVRRAQFYEDPQGNSERALATLKTFDEIVGGRPDAELVRAQAEWDLQKNSAPKDAEEHRKRSREAAWIALLTDPGQDATPSRALFYLDQQPIDRTALSAGNALSQDFPIRTGWPGDPRTDEARLQFSTNDLAPMERMLVHATVAQRATLIAELDHRFIGNPDAVILRLDNPVQGHPVSANEVKQAIASDAENWELYARLVNVYIGEGRYHDASELAQSFPPFRKDTTRTVEYAIDAAEVGNKLLLVGAVDDARPLLKISADYKNGSSSSMGSQAKLYLLDNHLPEAAMTFLADAQHYDSRSDFRDFLCLLFASGDSLGAWQGFNQLIVKLPGPSLWTAALVGHRRDNIRDEELRQWLEEKSKSLALRKGDDALLDYAMSERFIDRGPPPDDFPEFIKALEGPSGVFRQRVSRTYMTYFGPVGDDPQASVGPGAFGAKRQHDKRLAGEVPGRHYLLALAYSSLRHGRWEEATQRFDRLAQIYEIESDLSWGFVLPYFAFAAAQCGDDLGLEHYLDTQPHRDGEWGWQLAQAVFAALHNKPQDAQNRLDTAFRHRPTASPIAMSYQYAEICIWLFEKTHDAGYKQRALDWARKHVQIEPAHAWAYALIARYSDSAQERAMMLPKALYLDPQSHWATTTPKEAQAVALASLKEHKPFDLHKNAPPDQHL